MKNFKLIISAIFLLFMISANVEAKYKFNPPVPTTEFEKMPYSQLYPMYSWKRELNFYQIQVIRQDGSKEIIVRDFMNTESLDHQMDTEPFTEKGDYYWQVRVVDKNKNPLSDWSEKKYFAVTMPTTFAALGDSITHGGDKFHPGGQFLEQWENYCTMPIKNLALSGDTTSGMLKRFDRDVLTFRPKVLIIMGGINDIRASFATADEVIKNFTAIREKCLENDITPVFITMISMNPPIMTATCTNNNWQNDRQKVNQWIISNQYHLDLNSQLEDSEKLLKLEYTVDGLHPNAKGKKIMGELINDYLQKMFPNLLK